MAKQTFTAGQVLTAAQMNNLQTDIFNQTTSTKTANYSLVVGDRGTRVIGNGTSITFTVDNNIFTAGDTIKIHNINSTALTIAAGSGVTINAAAGLTMAQWQEATLFATSASSFILFESTASSAQGLTLINTTSFSGVSSQSISNVFSATYQSYKLVLSNMQCTSTTNLTFRFRDSGGDDSGANYRYGGFSVNDNGAPSVTAIGSNTAQTTALIGSIFAQFLGYEIFVANPFLTATSSYVTYQGNGSSMILGKRDGNASYTGFTLIPSAGTITGTVRVYGYNE